MVATIIGEVLQLGEEGSADLRGAEYHDLGRTSEA